MAWPDARQLRWTPTEVVRSDDGTGLAVEVVADDHHEGPTVVFSHGWTLSSRSWAFQRLLAERYRLVLWDHRGHGESEPGPRGHRTIDQLGEDLLAVLTATCGGRDVVLVGHSMGGMTIMSLAASHPEVIGTWVKAVALVDTSAALDAESATLGMPAPLARAMSGQVERLMEVLRTDPARAAKLRRPGTRSSKLIARLANFGPGVDRDLVDFVEALTSATPSEVVGDFWTTLGVHDKLAALDAFAHVPTLVVVGERDRLTPVADARAIAAAVPGSRLLELDRAGHSTMLERPGDVNAALGDLIAGVAQHRGAAVIDHPAGPTPTEDALLATEEAS